MNSQHNVCDKCGSQFINFENRVTPINYSCFGTFCLVLLLFVPIVNIFVLVYLLTRKHVDTQVIAVCTDCGYKKNITYQQKIKTKKENRKTLKTLLLVFLIVDCLMVFLINLYF